MAKFTDLGLKKITRNVKQLKTISIKAGLTSESGAHNIEKGFYNHFGTRNIPPRPFIDAPEYDKDVSKSVKSAVEDIVYKKAGVKASLKDVGKAMKKSIQTEIEDLQSPANAPSTIKQKGFNNPLIETKQMHGSINYKIEG